MRRVDSVVATLDRALARAGTSTKSVERWKAEMPAEEEMRPKDKYTMFDRKVRGFRKGVHSTLALEFAWIGWVLTRLQNYQSGRECRRG